MIDSITYYHFQRDLMSTSREIVDIFYFIDEFCAQFMPWWQKQLLTGGTIKRRCKSTMSVSEVLTIITLFHSSSYRTFKAYYLDHVCIHLRHEFPRLVSYSRFIELIRSVAVPAYALAHSCGDKPTGISFIDSTHLAVCDPHRIHANRVFAGSAKRGKTSMGWFFGFKLHLVITDQGGLVHFVLTQGNVSDNSRIIVDKLTKNLYGKLFGDKGYLSTKLRDWLRERGIILITKIKRNMKNCLIPLIDKLLLRKRALIETVNDQLKNIYHIDHTRHRSRYNFVTNIMTGLIAYHFSPRKPSLHLDWELVMSN